MHPLDGVGIDVGRGHLDGGGEIDDRLAIRGWLPHVEDGVADLDGVLELGACEGLGGVLEVDLGTPEVLGVLAAQLSAVGRDVLDAIAIEAEHDATLERGRGVVQMNDRLGRAGDRFVGALDQVLARLGQNLDHDVVGDEIGLDELTDEVEVGLTRRGESDLDLLVAHLDEQLEHPQLARRGHRIDECLVSVTKIHGTPARCLGDDLRGPGPIREIDRGEGGVATPGHLRGPLGVAHVIGRRVVVGAGHDVLAGCGGVRPGSNGRPARQHPAARRPA